MTSDTKWPRCEKCGGVAVSNASGDITRTCIHCGSIVKRLPQHIDSDRHRGPSDWDRECQESRRINR